MKIEFKGFAHYPRMSEETLAWVANDLTINGVSYGRASSDGQGGCACLHHHAIDVLQKHAETLPEELVDIGKSEPWAMQPNWETVLSDAVIGEINKKLRKKKYIKCISKETSEEFFWPLTQWATVAKQLWLSPTATFKATKLQALKTFGTIEHKHFDVTLVEGADVPEDQL
jgi:hypothetical protein